MREAIVTTAEWVKNIRIKIGRNQTEFGGLIGKDKTSISLYESGKRMPGFPTIRKIVDLANANGMDVKYSDIRDE